jgi:GTP pyrophosphokinase
MVSYAKSKGYNLSDYLVPKYQEAVQRKYGMRDWDAVLAAIGHGGLK